MDTRRSLIRFTLATVVTVPLLFLLQVFVLRKLPDSQYFMPHGHCFLWNPALVALHAVSDSFIGLSYIIISITLAYLVNRADRNIPFPWLFAAFGIFIIACGATHIMEVITLWQPTYWLSGGLKLITAISSVATAVVLPPMVPKIIDVIRSARVSEERKAELELLYARLKEVDQVKTDFFANVSHELRTPLTLILGPTQRLLSRKELDQEERRSLELIARNANLLLKHVNDLLDVSKLEAGKMEVHYVDTDLARLLRLGAANFESLAQQRRISLVVETSGEITSRVDREKIERVILNLLSNAFKFTPDGGIIYCRARMDGDHAVIEVRDSGPGVPESLRSAVFERFRQADSTATRRFGGTGLGLSIAKEFVDLHDGTILVDDALEGGASFSVILPIRMVDHVPTPIEETPTPLMREAASRMVQELEPTNIVPVSSNIPQDAPLVLVIEDNRDMNRFIADELARDYRVLTAFDGQEGLEMAAEARPDLIISDLMMPRISGDLLIQRLRQRPELDHTPIVLLTARTNDDVLIRLLREGAQDYLVKPFVLEELRVRVDNLIKMKQVRDVLQGAASGTSPDLAVMATELSRREQELQSTLLALERSETKLRRLVDSNIIGIVFANLDGRITDANQAFLEMVGYTRQEMADNLVRWDLMTAPEYREQNLLMVAQLRANGVSGQWEKEYIRKDGSRVSVLVAIAMVEGSLNECIAINLDLTERKRFEAELHDAKETAEAASRAKDRFLAILSHELRTPLTPVLAATNALADATDIHGENRMLLEVIQRNVELEARLIDDLLDITRLSTGKLTLELHTVDAHLQVRNALDICQADFSSKGIVLVIDLAAEHHHVQADAARLQQILWNILKNAAKFTPQGGEVTVRTANNAAGNLVIEISDTGIGIEPEVLPRVFNAFEQGERTITRRYGGMGLGLAISRMLVEMHNGQLTIASEGKDRGTTLTLVLIAE